MQSVLDEVGYDVDNGLPPLIKYEEDMTQKETLIEIQSTLRDLQKAHKPNWWQRWGFGILTLLVAMGAWLQPEHKQATDLAADLHVKTLIDDKFKEHDFDSLVSGVAELKGQMKEIGDFQKIIIGRLIRQDSNLPKGQFAESLSTLAATVDAAKAHNAPIDLATLKIIQDKLSVAPTSSPGYWSAASSLVSYHSATAEHLTNDTLPNCWSTYRGHWEDGRQPSDALMFDDQNMGHCLLTLDDGPQFRESGFGKAYEEAIEKFPRTQLRLFVHDAIISYSGSKPIPFSSLECRNCVFKVNIEQPPIPPGQKIMRQLLASDLNDVHLTNAGF